MEIEAARYPVHFTDSSVISLSMGFLLFCSDLSKVFALSLAHEKLGSGLKVVTESSLVYAKIGSDRDLKYYWTEIIGAHAYGSGPTNVEHRIVPYPGSITRQELLWAMERFSIAHEYAHHIAGHGKREFATRGLDAEGLDEEYEADVFALALSRHLGSKDGQINLWSVSGAGAVLLLKCLECVRRARQVLLTGEDVVASSGSHPERSDRIRAFNYLVPTLPEREQLHFRLLRENVEAIVDQIWPSLKAYFKMMYENSLRPEGASGDSWLPRL